MSDLSKLSKFLQKDYRDGYLQTAVRGNIAYQIQALREKFKLTQTAFADKLGKKQSVVSRLEDSEYGKVTVQTLLDVACSLDVALMVRFVSYPEFLTRTQNMSIEALQPQTIFESVSEGNSARRSSYDIGLLKSVGEASNRATAGTALANTAVQHLGQQSERVDVLQIITEQLEGRLGVARPAEIVQAENPGNDNSSAMNATYSNQYAATQ